MRNRITHPSSIPPINTRYLTGQPTTAMASVAASIPRNFGSADAPNRNRATSPLSTHPAIFMSSSFGSPHGALCPDDERAVRVSTWAERRCAGRAARSEAILHTGGEQVPVRRIEGDRGIRALVVVLQLGAEPFPPPRQV